MKLLTHTLIALIASAGLFACSTTVQGVADGVDGGDGSGEVCEDPNLTSCDGVCVDTDVNPTYCGSCGNTCDEGQGCSAGECVDLCEPGFVNCGGQCIDPQTDADFCGASGTCSGANAGVDCGDQSCSAGTCQAAKRYLGSLTASNGRFTYGGTVGLDGAIAECQSAFSEPTATVCNFAHLLDAQSKGELVNAADTAGNPVETWHLVDPNRNNTLRQCIKTDGENVPWSYPTADLGQGGTFVSVDRANGTVSQAQETLPSTTDGCGAVRHVPCCLP